MSFVRRDTLALLFAGLAAAALVARAESAAASRQDATKGSTKQFPPFELQGSRAALAGLASDVAEYSVQRNGKSVTEVWLRGRGGNVSLVSVDQRDLQPMFQVFALGLTTLDELRTLWRQWQAPALPADLPEPWRALVKTKPPKPTPPQTFEKWPFKSWRTQVLRRAEFIIEDVRDVATFGSNPNMQSAARPRSVPPEASAACDIDVGLLFTGDDDRRLLLSVDWMPLKMMVTDEAARIDAYLGSCEAISLETYLQRNPARA